MNNEPITNEEIKEVLNKAPETKGKKVQFPSSPQKVNAEHLQPYVKKILKSIGVKNAWLSDGSSLGDFSVILDEESLPEVQTELGLDSLGWRDPIHEIAQRMYDKASNSDPPRPENAEG